jgi:hypothetical protein
MEAYYGEADNADDHEDSANEYAEENWPNCQSQHLTGGGGKPTGRESVLGAV